MKIGKKLIIMIVSIDLLGIGILIATVLSFAKKEINFLVNNEIRDLAEQGSGTIEQWLGKYLHTAETVAQIMETELEDIEVSQRRAFFNMMLRGIVERNPDMAALSTGWEPNALDGMDAQYVNTPGTDQTGRFIPYWTRTANGVSVVPLVQYEVPGPGDYYLVSRKTGKETLMEPYFYDINGQNRLITTVTVPVKSTGRFLGAVIIDIDIARVQQEVTAIRPHKGSIAAVFSNGGLVGGHFDPSRLGKSMRETERDIAGPYLESLVQAIKEGKPYAFSNYVAQFDTEMYFSCVPIKIGNEIAPWSLMVGVPKEIITAPVLRMLGVSIPIVLGLFLFITLAAVFMSRSISRPLSSMIQTLDAIGEGNLTGKLDIQSKDEIGVMSLSFNSTLDKIHALMALIKDKARSLSNIGVELSANMTETAAAINQITANIQGMKDQVDTQSASVKSAGTALEKITLNIDKLNEHIDNQGNSVSQSSSAIEQMIANIQSVTQTLIKNTDNVKNLSEDVTMGRADLEMVSQDIQGIARESEGLLEINTVMENIASQTNLLSMNAAIEAAHAGEAGKGFAVVADEIRKLAESSGEQSKVIAGVLKKIKTSIDTIIASTNVVLSRFETIDKGIQIVSLQEEHIRNAMEEQGVGSKQILEAIAQLKEITNLVKGGSADMLSESKELIEESKTLERISQEITNGMNEMASGAEQINAAVSRVTSISGENKSTIGDLMQEVSKFKISD